jgi:6-phosphogluconate dehydrogenase
MRDLSAFGDQREKAGKTLYRQVRQFKGDQNIFLIKLGHALYTGMIITYAQGMALLASASDKYRYQLDLEVVAHIWRGGCIIRAALLEEIQMAFRSKRDLSNLLLDLNFSKKVMEQQEDLRHIVCQAAESGVPVPALMASLSYLDAYRSSWLPANLIQAQRDYFGAHTYERIDTRGTFHTEWGKG